MKKSTSNKITVKNVAISKRLVQSVLFIRGTASEGISATTAGRDTIWVTNTRTGLFVATNRMHWSPSKFIAYTPDVAFAKAAAVLWNC